MRDSKKIIFILGGAKAGKSNFAIKLAKELNKEVCFLATAIVKDDEMRIKVNKHKKIRPPEWHTIEEGIELDRVIKEVTEKKYQIIIIDCIGFYIANLIFNYQKNVVIKKINKFINNLKKLKKTIIIVSNEVGLGIIPDNKLSREYREILGNVNQEIAKLADEVYFLIASLPIRLK